MPRRNQTLVNSISIVRNCFLNDVDVSEDFDIEWRRLQILIGAQSVVISYLLKEVKRKNEVTQSNRASGHNIFCEYDLCPNKEDPLTLSYAVFLNDDKNSKVFCSEECRRYYERN